MVGQKVGTQIRFRQTLILKFVSRTKIYQEINFQRVWGFISGGLTWFAIPFTLATTMGLAYLGLSSAQGAPMLSDDDVARGTNTFTLNVVYLHFLLLNHLLDLERKLIKHKICSNPFSYVAKSLTDFPKILSALKFKLHFKCKKINQLSNYF